VYVTVALSVFGVPFVHVWLVIAPSEPCAGAAATEKMSSHVSASFPFNVMTTGVSSVVELAPATAFGGCPGVPPPIRFHQ
jgi:hypothetical protein